MSLEYPSLLRPTGIEILLVNSQELEVPKLELRLRKWTGTAIADDFGRKPLLDLAGRPAFAELCVYELFRLSGWEARWIETYGAPAKTPKCFTHWLPDKKRAEQAHQPVLNEQILSILQRMTVANQDSYAGCWDVLGWYNSTILFAELKRYKKDRIRSTQPRWLEAGLQIGLQPANFLLVEWDFL